jgi:hypothetical protein
MANYYSPSISTDPNYTTNQNIAKIAREVSKAKNIASLPSASVGVAPTNTSNPCAGSNTRIAALEVLVVSLQNQIDALTATITGFSGYIMGGNSGGIYYDVIDRLKFNDNSSTAITATLYAGRYGCIGFNSSSAGYATGGYIGFNSDSIDKFTFSTETDVRLTGTLSVLKTARYHGAGLNSSSNGYTAAGDNSTVISKLIFANDTNDSIVSVISRGRSYTTGINSSTNGYTVGGRWGGVNYIGSIEKIVFSTDTNSTISAVLSAARDEFGGFNSTSAGYIPGGYQSPAGIYSRFDKFIFSGETCAQIAATNLSIPTLGATGINSNISGFTCGGYAGGTDTKNVDRMIFSTEVNGALGDILSNARSMECGVQSGGYL